MRCLLGANLCVACWFCTSTLGLVLFQTVLSSLIFMAGLMNDKQQKWKHKTLKCYSWPNSCLWPLRPNVPWVTVCADLAFSFKEDASRNRQPMTPASILPSQLVQLDHHSKNTVEKTNKNSSGHLTLSLLCCQLKTTTKSAKFEILRLYFCFLFCISNSR